MRAELIGEITEVARRHLARDGAAGLSLRAVAREMGMVSSAIYRYYPSRDDLLTALIIDGYNAVGEAVEKAEAACSRADHMGRWLAVCHAVRDWAVAHPQEYALLYGSPVPGYSAPQETVGPASRVPIALLKLARDAWDSRTPALIPEGPPLSPTLAAQTEQVAAAVAPGLPGPVLTRYIIGWTQLFGMISFELFGHLVGSVDPADDFFAHAVEHMAEVIHKPQCAANLIVDGTAAGAASWIRLKVTFQVVGKIASLSDFEFHPQIRCASVPAGQVEAELDFARELTGDCAGE